MSLEKAFMIMASADVFAALVIFFSHISARRINLRSIQEADRRHRENLETYATLKEAYDKGVRDGKNDPA